MEEQEVVDMEEIQQTEQETNERNSGRRSEM
jgi:hypothetical protein